MFEFEQGPIVPAVRVPVTIFCMLPRTFFPPVHRPATRDYPVGHL